MAENPVNNENELNKQAEDSNESERTQESSNNDKVIELPHGNALNLSETYKITSSKRAKLVILAGSSGSGKTTLVTAIYHLFQKNLVKGYLFAGSETLMGFEQRASLSRTQSQNASPQVAKTRRGVSDTILHLRLCDYQTREFRDLLLSDFSGENYRDVIANVELARAEFSIIKRADNFVLLIDGDLISQKEYRHGAELESIELLKTLYAAELIQNNITVDVIISKYDIVLQRSRSDNSIKDFIKNLQSKFNAKFGSYCNKFRFLEIAAMPENTKSLEFGFGLNKLIPCWFKVDSSCFNLVSTSKQNVQFSEFNLFAIRTFG